MANQKERRGLGRGLSALMADVDATQFDNSGSKTPDRTVPIETLIPNPDQPRRVFTDEHIQELTESIKAKGIIQPLIVRVHPTEPDKYQIIAGERRWRAAQRAQLHSIPVLVRDFNDTEVLEIAIIENIQRADLNPIEEARAFRQLMSKFGHTQEKLAEELGKSRSHIANLLRLLNLPEDVQDYVSEGKITAGHARALVTASNAKELAEQIIQKNLSVRDIEKLVRGPTETQRSKAKQGRQESEKDADTKALENDLSAALDMKVVIDHDLEKASGTLTVKYKTLDELDALCSILSSPR